MNVGLMPGFQPHKFILSISPYQPLKRQRENVENLYSDTPGDIMDKRHNKMLKNNSPNAF